MAPAIRPASPVRRYARAAGCALAALVIAAVTVLSVAGCDYGYPHACDGHGGTRVVLKGIYYCRDGSVIGAGWLWLHPHDPRARS